MTADRWSFLAVQAFIQKILTFRQTERQDERWELRERLLLDEIDRQREIDLRRLLYFGHMMVAQNGEAYDEATAQYDLFYKLLLPYDGKTSPDREELAAMMVKQYKLAFGDPADRKETADART